MYWAPNDPRAYRVLDGFLNIPEQCMTRLCGARVFVRQFRHAQDTWALYVNKIHELACVFSSFSQVRVRTYIVSVFFSLLAQMILTANKPTSLWSWYISKLYHWVKTLNHILDSHIRRVCNFREKYMDAIYTSRPAWRTKLNVSLLLLYIY